MESVINYFRNKLSQDTTPKDETLPKFLDELMNAAFAQVGVYGSIKYNDSKNLDRNNKHLKTSLIS